VLDLFIFLFLSICLNYILVKSLIEFIIPSSLFNMFVKGMYEVSVLRSVISSFNLIYNKQDAYLIKRW
jgi:Na+/alanine symporter